MDDNMDKPISQVCVDGHGALQPDALFEPLRYVQRLLGPDHDAVPALYFTRNLDVQLLPHARVWADAFWLCPAGVPPLCYFRLTGERYAWLGSVWLDSRKRLEAAERWLKDGTLDMKARAEWEAKRAQSLQFRATYEDRLKLIVGWVRQHPLPTTDVPARAPLDPPLLPDPDDLRRETLPQRGRIQRSPSWDTAAARDLVAWASALPAASLPADEAPLCAWLTLLRPRVWLQTQLDQAQRALEGAALDDTVLRELALLRASTLWQHPTEGVHECTATGKPS